MGRYRSESRRKGAPSGNLASGAYTPSRAQRTRHADNVSQSMGIIFTSNCNSNSMSTQFFQPSSALPSAARAPPLALSSAQSPVPPVQQPLLHRDQLLQVLHTMTLALQGLMSGGLFVLDGHRVRSRSVCAYLDRCRWMDQEPEACVRRATAQRSLTQWRGVCTWPSASVSRDEVSRQHDKGSSTDARPHQYLNYLHV